MPAGVLTSGSAIARIIDICCAIAELHVAVKPVSDQAIANWVATGDYSSTDPNKAAT